VALKTPCP